MKFSAVHSISSADYFLDLADFASNSYFGSFFEDLHSSSSSDVCLIKAIWKNTQDQSVEYNFLPLQELVKVH